jgi:hypothetical protein
MKSNPLARTAPMAAACLIIFSLLSCKKSSTSSATATTVQLGYYSLVGLYAINSNGTYTSKPVPSCLASFLLNLQASTQMQLQDACLSLAGTWGYANSVLTVTAADGTVEISGAVSFEADGITIDVNNTVDNTRYQLYRN